MLDPLLNSYDELILNILFWIFVHHYNYTKFQIHIVHLDKLVWHLVVIVF